MEERRMIEEERFNRQHNAAKLVGWPLVGLGIAVQVICLLGMIATVWT